jgi:hypothetical protein
MSNNLGHVKIEPIEYDCRKSEEGKNPRIIRYRGILFKPNLSVDEVERLVKTTHSLKRQVTVSLDNDGFIWWKYGDCPQIGIDRTNNTFVATVNAIAESGMRECQTNAAIFLKMLKKRELAKCYSVSATYNPYKMGSDLNDVEVTFDAFRELIQNYERTGSKTLVELAENGRRTALERKARNVRRTR